MGIKSLKGRLPKYYRISHAQNFAFSLLSTVYGCANVFFCYSLDYDCKGHELGVEYSAQTVWQSVPEQLMPPDAEEGESLHDEVTSIVVDE